MIAIKGIEIPENCSDCDLCHGHICRITGTDIVTNPKGNCPLVEIVTCKDCKNNKNGVCPNYRHFVDDDFYCANAERRE